MLSAPACTPLKFFKKHERDFPDLALMALMARSVFSLTGASVEPESLFSSAKHVLHNRFELLGARKDRYVTNYQRHKIAQRTAALGGEASKYAERFPHWRGYDAERKAALARIGEDNSCDGGVDPDAADDDAIPEGPPAPAVAAAAAAAAAPPPPSVEAIAAASELY